MTFLKEEEVFPTVNVTDDLPNDEVGKEKLNSTEEKVNSADNVVEEKHNGKRKQPDKQVEKKVFAICPLFLN